MIKRNPVILTLVSYYAPGFRAGGPIVSVANLVAALGDEFEFQVIARDRDLGDRAPFAARRAGAWIDTPQGRVFYAPPAVRRFDRLASLIAATDHDILFLNSVFDAALAVQPLMARRFGLIPRKTLVIAPRGEFAPAALALHAWKKQAYLRLARGLQLFDDVVWMASGAHEADDIAAALIGGALQIRIAPDLPRPISAPIGSRPAPDYNPAPPLRIVHLSRIHPMKNLDFALRALGRVRAPVQLGIYGPIEDVDYWRQCNATIAKLPGHVRVAYHGEVATAEVANVFAAHDLFFLPTRGENFGHVIVESLAAGTPVLLSERTSWQAGPLDCCTVLPLSSGESVFAAFVDRFAAMPENARIAAREAARRYAQSVISDQRPLRANRKLFADAPARLDR